MTIMFLGHDRARRKKQSHQAPQPQPQPVAQNVYASVSTVNMQQQISAPPVQIPHRPAYSPGSSQHPVYGAVPQPHGAPAHSPPPYGSAYLQPVQPYIGNSTANLGAHSPPKEHSGLLKSSYHKASHLTSRSYSNLKDTLHSGASKSRTELNHYVDQSTNLISKKSTQALNQGAALCDLISSKLDAVITSIDGEHFSGQEHDLMLYPPSSIYDSTTTLRLEPTRSSSNQTSTASSKQGSNYFSKAWLYSNGRLPPYLPPFKAYMPTFPMLCLAASYSERVYTAPAPKTLERETHIPSDWRSGTKAMVLKSVPIDDMNLIVFAVRGSATFMDWAVNLKQLPTSPAGFLDDEGNLCHAGFLAVARQMITPVADRLKTLLQENPGRSNASLLITGHSAGGAVAALLFAHMMSTNVSSDLSYLTAFFKRVHCVTFGAPPVSLLPLSKPKSGRHRHSIFYSFINEGDPVPRADKGVVRSLLKLYASPAPTSVCTNALSTLSNLHLSSSTSLQTTSSKPSKTSKFSKVSSAPAASAATAPQPAWTVPPSTLSAAGRLIVLRNKPGTSVVAGKGEEEVEAVTIDDELLRTVMFGDPVKHMMSLYRRRVEWLATTAATAKGY